MKRLREKPNSVKQRERMDRPEETYSRSCHYSRKNVAGDPEVGVSTCIHSWPFCQPPGTQEWEIIVFWISTYPSNGSSILYGPG